MFNPYHVRTYSIKIGDRVLVRPSEYHLGEQRERSYIRIQPGDYARYADVARVAVVLDVRRFAEGFQVSTTLEDFQAEPATQWLAVRPQKMTTELIPGDVVATYPAGLPVVRRAHDVTLPITEWRTVAGVEYLNASVKILFTDQTWALSRMDMVWTVTPDETPEV